MFFVRVRAVCNYTERGRAQSQGHVTHRGICVARQRLVPSRREVCGMLGLATEGAALW